MDATVLALPTQFADDRAVVADAAHLHADAGMDEALDQVLRLVADEHRLLGLRLGRRSFSPSLAELRQSPLGRDLRLVLAAAEGDPVALEDGPAVREAVARVVATLLKPVAAEGHDVPAWFWGSEIGRIVARAERRAAGEGAWLAAPVAAAALGVDERSLLDWIGEGLLAWLPDDAGRPLVSRAAVDRMRSVALLVSRGGGDASERLTA